MEEGSYSPSHPGDDCNAYSAYPGHDCLRRPGLQRMDELPPGRQPVKTVHRYDSYRTKVMDFIRSEIDTGRQVYIIFPLIEESAKVDYENLMQGYENVKAFFPE